MCFTANIIGIFALQINSSFLIAMTFGVEQARNDQAVDSSFDT